MLMGRRPGGDRADLKGSKGAGERRRRRPCFTLLPFFYGISFRQDTTRVPIRSENMKKSVRSITPSRLRSQAGL